MNAIASFSSPVQDFALSVARLCLWLVILSIIFVPLERLFARTPAPWARPQMGNDLFYYFFTSLFPAALLALPLALLAKLVALLVPAGLHAFVHQLPVWAAIAAGLVVADIGSYWGHRFSHEWPLIWRFHSLHHSAEHIDYLVNGRAHPIDVVWVRMCGLVPVYILGLGSTAGAGSIVPAVITIVGTLASFFVHANVRWRFGPLEWLVATPAFHHWHHSKHDHINHNYAATFPWIDAVFGTLYLAKHFPAEYGIADPLPTTIIGQMLAPFAVRHIPSTPAREGNFQRMARPPVASSRLRHGDIPAATDSVPAFHACSAVFPAKRSTRFCNSQAGRRIAASPTVPGWRD